MNEEHWVVGSRAGEWEIRGVDQPSWSVPVTVVAKVRGVVDTEGLRSTYSVQDLFKVPESVGSESLLDLFGTNPLTESGLGTTDGGWGVFPEGKVASQDMRFGEVYHHVGECSIVNLEAGSSCHSLVRNCAVSAESDFWVGGEDGGTERILPVHGIVPVWGWTIVAALFSQGDFTEPDEPTMPRGELKIMVSLSGFLWGLNTYRSGTVETEPVVLVDLKVYY